MAWSWPTGAFWPRRRFATPAWLLALLAWALLGAACIEQSGTIEVTDFQLIGAQAISAADVLKVLATRTSGRLPWSQKQYFDRGQFDADLKRIVAYYADHGYPHARVTAVDVAMNATQTAVKLKVTIAEGTPVVVDDIKFVGFGELSPASQKSLGSIPLKVGAPRVFDQVRATRDQATQLFLNAGHPQAYVDALERPAAAPDHVRITFYGEPGPAMTFGAVTVNGLQDVGRGVVMRELAFQPGSLYREDELRRTQHELSRLDVFQVVNVTARADAITDDQVPVQVTVAEAPHHQLKLGVGYGSEELLRGTVDWKRVNFLGGARDLEVNAKGSFLDRGVKITLTEPFVGLAGLSLALTGTVWYTDQLTYNSQTYGGRATFSYERETNLSAGRNPVRYGFHLALIHEYLSYGIDPSALADLSSRAERIALGFDPTTGRGAGTLGAVAFDAERTQVDRQLDPHRGTSLSLHAEHAAPWLLGTYQFNELLGEAKAYVPLGSWVLAGRVRLGSVVAADPTRVPFSKLYFLGGSTSERGWGLYEISPLDANGLPIGGRTLAESSLEVRVPISARISVVGFVDVGDVSAGNWDFSGMTPRVDVGAGLRYSTQIGVVRVDYGHQLNPIPGLIVNGAPQTRYWRLHFSIGQAF